MASWFVTFSILLLFSASVLEARFRLNAKRRYPVSTKSLVSPPYPMADNSRVASDDEDSLTESSTPAGRTKNRASEEQVQQFARLIYERLNLKEPPNVTVHAPDGTGIPSSIVKQLEQHPGHYLHGETADSFQPSYRDEAQPTTERAILPGDLIQHHTCQRQLAVKFGFSRETVNTIECFRFTKSPVESKGLPTNQMITQLRIYVKKNYFQPYDSLANMLTPDMFQVYLVFRPTSNETSPNPFRTLTGTIHLALSQVKQLNDKWLELTISSHNVQGGIQQVYQQLITPWYGVAINRELQRSPAWPSYYRRYHTKKNMDGHLRPSNEDEDDASKDSPQQLPYMLVEYGEKIAPSSAASRGTRGTKYTRPAATCDPKSPCCRRPLTIDLDQGNNDLNFVIYPRKIDIGECVGVCGASGSSLRFVDVKNDHERNEAHSGHNLLLLHYGSLQPKRNTTHPGRAEPPSSQCCSYSRTGGLELMYTTTNGGPIIRKLIPVPPSIRAESSLVYAAVGQSAELRCSAIAPFDTKISWRRVDNGTRSHDSQEHQQTYHGVTQASLSLADLHSRDFGFYACVAESRAGPSHATVELREHHRSATSHLIETNEGTTARMQILKRNQISDQTTAAVTANRASSLYMSLSHLSAVILICRLT